MTNSKLRQVSVTRPVSNPVNAIPDKPQTYEHSFFEWFHGWTEHNDNVIGALENGPWAIVEKHDGAIDLIHYSMIRFASRPVMDGDAGGGMCSDSFSSWVKNYIAEIMQEVNNAKSTSD